MSDPISIQSSSQWQGILNSTNVVVADFYADWCGPCKQIAPHFAKMSQEYSKPKKVAFCKINVDSQSSISQSYGVSAMPTFIIFHGGQAIETIKGANPPALAAAVTKAIALPQRTGGGTSFQTPGRTLGGEGVAGRSVGGRAGASTLGFDPIAVFQHVVAVLGLYLVSLFAIDSYNQARQSHFNKVSPQPRRAPSAASGAASRSKEGAARSNPSSFRTFGDLNKDE